MVIAILGILAAIAIPRLTGFQDTARTRAGTANAKLLTTTYHVIVADDQTAPTTIQEILDATNAAGNTYIADGTDITVASYTLTNGIVTYTGTTP